MKRHEIFTLVSTVIIGTGGLDQRNHKTRLKASSNRHLDRESIFTEKPRDQLLKRNQERAVLRCSIGANNTERLDKVQWTKDGFGLGQTEALPEYPRYKITKDYSTGNADLVISDVEFEDDGLYECQVRPRFRVNAQVTVALPPAQIHLELPANRDPLTSIDHGTSVLTVVEGRPTDIDCVVPASRPPTNLSVVATDKVGLSAVSPQHIFQGLRAELDEADLARWDLEVVDRKTLGAVGERKRAFIGGEDGRQLIVEDWTSRVYKSIARYNLNAAGHDPDGKLTCEGHYREIETTVSKIRKDYELNVLTRPRVKTELNASEVIEHQAIAVSCTVLSANPIVPLSFELLAAQRGLPDHTLDVSALQVIDRNDLGLFIIIPTRDINKLFCQAENPVGKSDVPTSSIHFADNAINVWFGPDVRQGVANTETVTASRATGMSTALTVVRLRADVGENVKIDCGEYFDSNPAASFEGSAVVWLNNVQSNQSGDYGCKAWNEKTELGSELTAQLQVFGKPYVRSLKLQTVAAITSDNKPTEKRLFKCSYVSYPGPSEVKFILQSTENSAITDRVTFHTNNDNLATDLSFDHPVVSRFVEKRLPAAGDHSNTLRLHCRVQNEHGHHSHQMVFDLNEGPTFKAILIQVIIGLVITVLVLLLLALIAVLIRQKMLRAHAEEVATEHNTRDKVMPVDGRSFIERLCCPKNILDTIDARGHPTASPHTRYSVGSSKHIVQYDESTSLTDDQQVKKGDSVDSSLDSYPKESGRLDGLFGRMRRRSNGQILGPRSNSSSGEASSSSHRDDGYYTDGHHANLLHRLSQPAVNNGTMLNPGHTQTLHRNQKRVIRQLHDNFKTGPADALPSGESMPQSSSTAPNSSNKSSSSNDSSKEIPGQLQRVGEGVVTGSQASAEERASSGKSFGPASGFQTLRRQPRIAQVGAKAQYSCSSSSEGVQVDCERSDHIVISKTTAAAEQSIHVLPNGAGITDNNIHPDPYTNPNLMRQVTDRVKHPNILLQSNSTSSASTMKSGATSGGRRYTAPRRSKPCSQV